MKKISLFFATPVSKRMETDQEFAAMPGLRKAIRLPTELIDSILHYDKTGSVYDWESRAKIIGGRAWALFEKGHSSRQSLEDAVHKVYRIESSISLSPDPYIRLEIAFYRRGEKNFFFHLHFGIHLPTGSIVTLYVGTYSI